MFLTELHFSCFMNKKPSHRKNSSVPYVVQTVDFLVVYCACVTFQYGRQIARQLDRREFKSGICRFVLKTSNPVLVLSVRIWPDLSVSFEETETTVMGGI